MDLAAQPQGTDTMSDTTNTNNTIENNTVNNTTTDETAVNNTDNTITIKDNTPVFEVTETMEELTQLLSDVSDKPTYTARVQFLQFVKAGWQYPEIAEVLDTAVNTLLTWMFKYTYEGGVDSLVSIASSGTGTKKASKITDEILDAVIKFCLEPRSLDQIHDYLTQLLPEGSSYSNPGASRAAIGRALKKRDEANKDNADHVSYDFGRVSLLQLNVVERESEESVESTDEAATA